MCNFAFEFLKNIYKNNMYNTTRMKKIYFFATILMAVCANATGVWAQAKVQMPTNATSFPLEGFFFEDNNRGYLAAVEVTMTDENGNVTKTASEDDGKFIATLEPNHTYHLRAEKRAFYILDTTLSTASHAVADPLYLKFSLKRLPGYIFDATISELLTDADKAAGNPAFAVDSVLVEIYNTTKKKEELVYNTAATNLFNFTLEQGNHYTIMLRKKGFFTKRLEANINIHGCILCFEGLGSINPGVVDNLTEKNTAGTLGANIQLKKIQMNQAIKIENIYYDYAKSDIRADAAKELDKLANILKDNPQLLIEIGSHTDARGGANENMTLSQARAEAAAGYIVSKGVAATRIRAKGHGETQLVNGCTDAVQCSEEEHQRNRRTEFTVTGVLADDPYEHKSLREIIEEQEFMALVMSNTTNETIQIGADGQIPEEVRRDLEAQQKREAEAAKNPAPPATPRTVISQNTPQTVVIRSAPEVAADGAAGMPAKPAAPATPKTKKGSKKTKSAAPVNIKTVVPEVKEMSEKSGDDALPPAPEEAPTAVPNEKIVENIITNEPSKPETASRAIPADCNGFKIELLQTEQPLLSDNVLFTQYKSVYREQLDTQQYAYLIGEYRSLGSAEGLRSRLTTTYPTAKIITYVNGKRQ
jgi:outer membrane protein OmpA-like peptidoglycan-associated protein